MESEDIRINAYRSGACGNTEISSLHLSYVLEDKKQRELATNKKKKDSGKICIVKVK
jgi:hypothetical protein